MGVFDTHLGKRNLKSFNDLEKRDSGICLRFKCQVTLEQKTPNRGGQNEKKLLLMIKFIILSPDLHQDQILKKVNYFFTISCENLLRVIKLYTAYSIF